MVESKSANWNEVPLGNILTYIEEPVAFDDMAQYTTITVKRRHGGLEAREKLFGHEIKTKKQFRLHPGAFILSRVQCWHAAFAIVPNEIPQNMIASQNYDQFTISPNVDERFFWWLSHSPQFIQLVRDSTSGVVIEKVVFNRASWLQKTIPLPPLAEQQRIVASVETISTRLNEALYLRQQTIEEIKILGRSTASLIFDASKLLKFPSYSLGEISEIRSGVTLGKILRGKTVRLPYLRVANVQDGHLDLRHIKEIDVLEEEKDKWKLQDGDILLTEGGDWDKLGRGTVWREEIPNCIHQNHIFRVRISKEQFDPDFLSRLLSSPYGKAYFQSASKQTTNLASINQRQLKAFKVFCPPLDEQQRIVAYLDGLQAKVDELRRLQSESERELSALMPSILDRAFKGEL